MLQAVINRIGLAGVLAVSLLFSWSDDARALTCTPGVGIDTSGFTLGCATPNLWAVLSINQPLSDKTSLNFMNGSGTLGSTTDMQVGVYGGKVSTSSTSYFSGDIVVTNGIYPSTQATDTKGVNMTPTPTPQLSVDNALINQARADALSAVSMIGSYVSTHTAVLGLAFDNGISNSTTPHTINATHSGLNLVTIGTSGNNKNISLNGSSEILTFSSGGFANVEFLVNVTGSFALDNGAKVVLSGLNADDILFNIETGGGFTMNHGSIAYGIVLDGGSSPDDILDNGSVLYGALIGGRNITLDHASKIKNQHTPFGCNIDDASGVRTCTIFRAPEPATLALLATGLLAWFGISWRSRSRRTRLTAIRI